MPLVRIRSRYLYNIYYIGHTQIAPVDRSAYAHIYTRTRPINNQWRNLYFSTRTEYLTYYYIIIIDIYVYSIYILYTHVQKSRHYTPGRPNNVSCSVTDILPLPVTIGRSHQSTVVGRFLMEKKKKKKRNTTRQEAHRTRDADTDYYIIIKLLYTRAYIPQS